MRISENFAFMIDSSPEVVLLAVDFHEHLVDMTSPFRKRAKLMNPFPPDLRCKHRAKPVPPEADRFVADIDAAFMQQVFYIPERQRETNAQHHRETDDLWAGFELLERRALGHAGRVGSALPDLNRIYLTGPSEKLLALNGAMVWTPPPEVVAEFRTSG